MKRHFHGRFMFTVIERIKFLDEKIDNTVDPKFRRWLATIRAINYDYYLRLHALGVKPVNPGVI